MNAAGEDGYIFVGFIFLLSFPERLHAGCCFVVMVALAFDEN